ncbi:MAG: TonB-dependent receptor, partial [Bacteroidota bacterium]
MRSLLQILTYVVAALILQPKYVFAQKKEHLRIAIESNTYPLQAQLSAFASYYDIHILYDSELIQNLATEHPFEAGPNLELQLYKLLRHTPLDFSKISSNTYVIIVKDKKGMLKGKVLDKNYPLIGASIKVSTLGIGTLTDAEGNFELMIPEGLHQVEVCYAGYKSKKTHLEIISGKIYQADFQLTEVMTLDQIVLLGSRSTPQAILEKPVPTELINAKQLSNSVYSETSQILHYLIPSFHSTHQTIADGTDHVDPATLRGLGPDQVLVLINGKRRHTSSLVNINGTVGRGSVGTDLNAIPSSAIQKIEVLRDGAAAQYGSDAIAGVINIILKDQVDQANFNFRSGISQEGDGLELQSNVNLGMKLGKSGGFVNANLDFLSRAAVNRSGNYTGAVFGESFAIGQRIYSDNSPEDLEFFFRHTPFEDRQVMEVGNSGIRNLAMVLNGSYPLQPNTEVYGNAIFSYRNGVSRGFYRFPKDKNRVVPELHPFGFSPEIHSDILDASFQMGLKTSIQGWKVDISQSQGRNAFDFGVENSNNASLGVASPVKAYSGGLAYAQYVSNIDFSRQFKRDIDLNIAFGGEFRFENFRIKPGEEASWSNGRLSNSNGALGLPGMQLFPGFQEQNQINKSRNNLGAYVDVESKWDKLLLGMAARFESYSDFGENLSWKMAARYSFNSAYHLRAAVSTGFRAPSLQQIYFNNLSTQIVELSGELTSLQVGTFNNEDNVSRAFGIDQLMAETSLNLSSGISGRLSPNLSFSFDAYHIQIRDRIVLSGLFKDGFEHILEPLGAGAAQFFTNAVSTRTLGMDFSLSAKFPMNDKESLSFSLLSNLNRTRVDKDAAGVPIIQTSNQLEGQEGILFNREEISRLEVAQPGSKIILNSLY